MTVKITLEYGSVEEAIVALGRLAQVAKVRRAAQATAGAPTGQAVTVPCTEASTSATSAAPAPTSITNNLVLPDTTRKPRGRPRKKEAAVGVTGDAQASRKADLPADPLAPAGVAPQAPAAASPTELPPGFPYPSEADAKAALEAYFEKHGPQKAMKVLADFGVSRLRDLPEGDRAKFIKACSK